MVLIGCGLLGIFIVPLFFMGGELLHIMRNPAEADNDIPGGATTVYLVLTYIFSVPLIGFGLVMAGLRKVA
ncbi:MAG: hypothetical protein AAF492_04195 [Verrucomicrobiota bacterium]